MGSERHRLDGLISGLPKDYRSMVGEAIRQGWTLDRGGRGHAILTSPDGTYSTPLPGRRSSSRHLLKDIRGRLVAEGFLATR